MTVVTYVPCGCGFTSVKMLGAGPWDLKNVQKKCQKEDELFVLAYYGDLDQFEQSRVETVLDAPNSIE